MDTSEVVPEKVAEIPSNTSSKNIKNSSEKEKEKSTESAKNVQSDQKASAGTVYNLFFLEDVIFVIS